MPVKFSQNNRKLQNQQKPYIKHLHSILCDFNEKQFDLELIKSHVFYFARLVVLLLLILDNQISILLN